MAGILDVLGGAGAASGILGAATGPIGLGLGLLPSAIKIGTSIAQRRRANKINPIAPDFVANSGILQNKQMINDYYNNYQLPAKQSILNNLSAGVTNGIDQATQAASSGGDILDAVTKLNYNQGNAINSLGLQEAQMKDALLPEVMQANAAAGNELVRKNQFDEANYQQQLQEKSALMQGSAANAFSGVDDFATVGGSLLNYKSNPGVSNKTSININPLPAIDFNNLSGRVRKSRVA